CPRGWESCERDRGHHRAPPPAAGRRPAGGAGLVAGPRPAPPQPRLVRRRTAGRPGAAAGAAHADGGRPGGVVPRTAAADRGGPGRPRGLPRRGPRRPRPGAERERRRERRLRQLGPPARRGDRRHRPRLRRRDDGRRAAGPALGRPGPHGQGAAGTPTRSRRTRRSWRMWARPPAWWSSTRSPRRPPAGCRWSGSARRHGRRGIPLLVDAAHAPGLIAAPLDGLDCDFWTGNLHKWGCAPRGTAALVARGPLRDGLYPLIDSWAAADPYPDRFDQQGTVDATHYLAASSALDFVEGTWGWTAARRYMDELAGYAERVVGAAFAALTGTDEGPVDVGMPVPGMRLVRLPEGLADSRLTADALRDRAAAELGVEAAFTSFGGLGYLRLSAHVYNTAEDYEYFAERCVPVLGEWARAAREQHRAS
ncbi:LOW QUALITY PROTEIN: conserved hypothetical protein, partial [Streptomyces griseoflavus Tu4000]